MYKRQDISSTRIRENIDYGRDISNLIDPVVQNFIYDNSLYLREPQYKNVFEAKNISFDSLKAREGSIIDDMEGAIAAAGGDTERIREYIGGPEVRTAVIRTVSYTHLDVYKRQSRCRSMLRRLR